MHRPVRKKLNEANLPHSTEQAWAALRTIHVVEFSFGNEKRYADTTGNHQARQILSALGRHRCAGAAGAPQWPKTGHVVPI